MALTFENVTPSLIPNTTMKKGILDGIHKNYQITPIAGYVLHDNTMDFSDRNFETMEETWKFGYSPSSVYVTCGANYDFSTHTVTDENGVSYTAYGNRDFFAKLESDVPDNQIFGGGDNNEHEVM